MALMTWSDNLSVKVAEIDEQHKRLIAMINELNDAMKVGERKRCSGKDCQQFDHLYCNT